MSIYVVRHAKAGSRRKWQGPDELRPLSGAGRRQADGIAKALSGEKITRTVSSPAVRCRQTIEPLAGRLRIPVDLSDALAEGAPLDESVRLLEKYSGERAVLCTHGDVMGNLVWHAKQQGVGIDEDRLEKGATWVFDLVASSIIAARYLPPSS